MVRRDYLEIAAWLGLGAIAFAAFLGPLLAWYFG
jgi:hypothetical protein